MNDDTIYKGVVESEVALPDCGYVKAGFPSPADDMPFPTLDLNRRLVRNPASTFYMTVSGDSMSDDVADDGDLLVVDRSIEPTSGCLAVCVVDGEFTLKRLQIESDHALLLPANSKYRPIRVTAENNFSVWGVVRYVIKKV
ncbi:MAG: translesion error-prone DNA polymerase V autoproteolytic subunit [Rikenellaceae bacterium]|nr:translesion error-prone DNA polymerase V autoproteolytic subunit [Rikenellaceae bacterium]